MHLSRAFWLVVVAALVGAAPATPAAVPSAAPPPPADVPALASSCAALRYPPYDPAVNYCGPEWLQESGYGWVVPREPIRGFDFSPACYVHDACYSECCSNGMAQGECDDQFLANLTNICTNTRDSLLAECSGLTYPVCVAGAWTRYLACKPMAGTYASAVSYLGDGVVETAPLTALLIPILGPVTGAAVAVAIVTLAPGIEIEAAYPCPCACTTCPADEARGAPSCQVTGQGAEVSQDLLRYHKETENVSGVGPVCECVSAEVTDVTPCPTGSTCAPNGLVCTSDLCDPANCSGEEIVGRCEQHGISILGMEIDFFGTLITEREVSACRAVDQYRSECATTTEFLGSMVCPGECAADGISCASRPPASLQLQVLEPPSYDSTTYVPCPNCRIRLRGAAGTFEGTTGVDGTLTVGAVPTGVYLAEYGCGPEDLSAHLPSDLASYPGVPVSWVLARGPNMAQQSGLPTIVTPVGGSVDVLTGTCGRAPVCSAEGMSATPAPQSLPAEVAATRQAIIEAAVSCDYQALGELAAWPYFAYRLGDLGGDPAGYWQTLEADGGQPLRWMVETLNLPFARVEVEGDVNYLWPAAFAASAWSEVPAAERQALIALYGPGVADDWAQGGRFARYRAAIGFDGLWALFMTNG